MERIRAHALRCLCEHLPRELVRLTFDYAMKPGPWQRIEGVGWWLIERSGRLCMTLGWLKFPMMVFERGETPLAQELVSLSDDSHYSFEVATIKDTYKTCEICGSWVPNSLHIQAHALSTRSAMFVCLNCAPDPRAFAWIGWPMTEYQIQQISRVMDIGPPYTKHRLLCRFT